MDVLTKDNVVIEIGSAAIEVAAQQKYIINNREYSGLSYRLFEDVDVPDYVKPGAYMYDGVGFSTYNGYFIHDSGSDESANLLQAIGNNVPVVDYFGDYERYSRLQGVEALPCFLYRLQFAPSNNQKVLQIVEGLAAELVAAKQEIVRLQGQQATQETMLIECFTDLDAALFGGDENAELV